MDKWFWKYTVINSCSWWREILMTTNICHRLTVYYDQDLRFSNKSTLVQTWYSLVQRRFPPVSHQYEPPTSLGNKLNKCWSFHSVEPGKHFSFKFLIEYSKYIDNSKNLTIVTSLIKLWRVLIFKTVCKFYNKTNRNLLRQSRCVISLWIFFIRY